MKKILYIKKYIKLLSTYEKLSKIARIFTKINEKIKKYNLIFEKKKQRLIRKQNS